MSEVVSAFPEKLVTLKVVWLCWIGPLAALSRVDICERVIHRRDQETRLCRKPDRSSFPKAVDQAS